MSLLSIHFFFFFRGLEQKIGETPVTKVIEGQFGLPHTGYQNEPLNEKKEAVNNEKEKNENEDDEKIGKDKKKIKIEKEEKEKSISSDESNEEMFSLI